MKKESRKFLEAYLNNTSPTGFESSGQELWLEYIHPYIDDYITDTYGNAVGILNPETPYKVVLEAHADEISWFVNYITDDGYLYVIRNGGSDPQIAPSKRVNIHTTNGSVKAVFGWPAIHVRNKEKDDPPTMKNIFLDCGCHSREEVEKLGIHVGSVVTFDDELTMLNNRYFTGRGLDNRIGGFMIAEVLKRLHENKQRPPFGLYVVNAVQEEIGLRGAEMISRRIKPDIAIITDVCHDTQSPPYNKKLQGDISCGKGPVLTYGPSVQQNLLKMLLEVAEAQEIPFQRDAVSRTTGTDTDSFAYSGEGVASALISLPLKYMHTTVESIHRKDVESVIELMYQFILKLDSGHDFRYIK